MARFGKLNKKKIIYLFEHSLISCYVFVTRAVARSENPGGLVVMGGDNVPTLVEIG